MEQDSIIISRIKDKLERCSSGYYPTSTGFLDSHEQALAETAIRKYGAGVHALFYGGYEDAERRILLCLPSDWPIEAADVAAELLCVLRVATVGTTKPLTHRDYLGALLGLGLDRSISGDILVRPDGADVIITSSIADFLLHEFTKVGRCLITTKLVDLSDLIVPAPTLERIRDTVPSLRLDNIVSSAFRLSRKAAVEAIAAGLVSVNHIEANKPDAKVDEGASIVLRGKGKVVLALVGGESKKSRIWVEFDKYV